MKIKCKAEDKKGVCDKILESKKEKPEEAFKELLTQLEIHLKGRHSEQLLEYQEDLKVIQNAVSSLPAWMLCNAFIDCDSEETSPEFKKGVEELDDYVGPLAELFEDSDDSEDQLDEEIKQELEKENLVEILRDSD